MKGMMDFLEKAGLVTKDAPAPEPAPTATPADSSVVPSGVPPATGAEVPGSGAPLNFEAIYAQAGIAPALYPAERLLRLLDGLSAMDEATRRMAIQAMDAADESWSIDDPLADAAAKAQGLAAYAAQLQQNLQALQTESQQTLQAIAARQEKVVGDIRQQIAELEGLVARELGRAAQETAAQEASLKVAQNQTARELHELSQVRQRLLGLSTQFSPTSAPEKE